MLNADDIVNIVSFSELDYDYRAAILAGYFDRITETNPEEVIKTLEVAKLLRWTFSKH